MNFETAVNDALNERTEADVSVERLFDLQDPCRRYVLGRNDDALKLVSCVPINGIIDDFSSDNQWHGIPVIKSKQIDGDAVIVNCSTSVSPISAQKKLELLPKSKAIWFYQAAAGSGGAVAPSQFVTEMRDNFLRQNAKWNLLLAQMADDQSVGILREIILFRLTGNPGFMQRHTVRLKEQYFEPFLGGGIQTFVDVGGFDGDTTEQFIYNYPKYRSVLFFEPSKTNIEKAKLRLAKKKNIQYFQMGASNQTTTLRFSGTLGSASIIDEKGAETIDVCRLDDVIKTKVDWIKMDIEGWELNALDGCIETIEKYKPVLSIAVYHHAEDFLRVPELVRSLRADYEIYLRHYTEGWSETIMYFIPKKMG